MNNNNNFEAVLINIPVSGIWLTELFYVGKLFYVGMDISKELASPNFKSSGIWNCSYCHLHTSWCAHTCAGHHILEVWNLH